MFCVNCLDPGFGGPGGGFDAPGGGFRTGTSSGKPLLLPVLKKPPPGAPKPPPGPPKPKKTKQKTEQKNKKTLFRSDPVRKKTKGGFVLPGTVAKPYENITKHSKT